MATPLAKRIETAQANLADLRDQLDKHIESLDDNPDDTATTMTDELTTRIDAQEKSLESLKRAEAQIMRSLSENRDNRERTQHSLVLHDDRGDRGNDRVDRGSEQAMIIRNPKPFATAMGPK